MPFFGIIKITSIWKRMRRRFVMSKYYAAVDMGASSGRLILGWMEDGKMQLEEVHRF